MSEEARIRALEEVCSAIANQGDVVTAFVTLVEPNGPQDQFPYRLLLENAERFRFDLGTADAPEASQFKVIIDTSLPISFQVTLPSLYSSVEDMLRASEEHGRDFTETSRLRHVIGILFHLLLSRQPAFLQALQSSFGFIPRQVAFLVSTEDACGDPGTVSLCRPNGRANVLMPDTFYFFSNAYDDYKQRVIAGGRPWAERSDIVLWRGSTTGRLVTARNPFENRRMALAAYCANYPDIFDVKISSVGQMSDADAEAVRQMLEARNLLAEWIDVELFEEHKFALNIDGNASAFGFFEKLSLGCCVLRVESSFEQWFDRRIQPWVHYVPIAGDFSDLLEKAQFMRANPAFAEQIAKAGFEFTLEADLHHEAGLFVRRLAASLDVRRISLTLTAPGADMPAWQSESLDEIWHGLEEGSDDHLYRWTKSPEVTWRVNLEAQANSVLNVAVLLEFPISPPFTDGCKIRLGGGGEFALNDAGVSLTAEIPIEHGGIIREVTLLTPPLFSPSDISDLPDERQLGLPIRVG